jgi:hypothetical protein
VQDVAEQHPPHRRDDAAVLGHRLGLALLLIDDLAEPASCDRGARDRLVQSILPWSNARIASCRSLKRGTVGLVDLLDVVLADVMKYTPSTMSCDGEMIGPPLAGLKMLCVDSISTCASAWASTD